MRFVVPLIALVTLSLTSAYAPASSIDNSPTALAELQTKADQAQPRDKCFLYAELVSQMTDLAGQQFNSGDSEQASETLKRVQRYAEKIHTGVADDSRKLRDAESLMRRTTFRLKGMLNKASYEDRPDLEKTLKELSQIQTELMMQVFKKSPAINDTFTGIASVDLLGEALTVLAEAPQCDGRWFDMDGKLRLQVRPLLLPRLAKQAFDQIRQAAADNPAVLIRLLSTIERLAPKLPGAENRRALVEQAAAVWDTANTRPLVKMDREDIEAAWQKSRTALASLEVGRNSRPTP